MTLYAIPLYGENEIPPIAKRLSNDALIRLIIRNHHNMFTAKRGEKRAELDRRSVDDDFSNCFLSPVQCMLPRSRR
ncbi:hypothetical protein DICVIV_04899 [Dictyocaulus viviparus]|uniref:Uncharacterized protein n=1 Tax=Dictyocaulus viviparus TaxID=29172 RepID=A0A0D8XWW0_DICVI|nr:hypothetical protein DICVIV_04899 [Dictyocaulus viviparus]